MSVPNNELPTHQSRSAGRCGALLARTKLLARRFNINPLKQRGQHFLVDEQVLTTLVKAAKLLVGDQVIEIGPGLGTLTAALLAKSVKLAAVELDKRFTGLLNNLASQHPNLNLHWGDALQLTVPQLIDVRQPYKIVASLPYNISAKFFRNFLWNQYRPVSITVLVQAEVAERICSKSGEMSLLSLVVQLIGQPKIIQYVKPISFWPPPQVNSAVLHINVAPKIKLNEKEEKLLWQLARIGFSARRKQFKNNLAAGYHVSVQQASDWLEQAGLGVQIRAQELSTDDWFNLAEVMNKNLF